MPSLVEIMERHRRSQADEGDMPDVASVLSDALRTLRSASVPELRGGALRDLDPDALDARIDELLDQPYGENGGFRRGGITVADILREFDLKSRFALDRRIRARAEERAAEGDEHMARWVALKRPVWRAQDARQKARSGTSAAHTYVARAAARRKR